MLETPTPSGAPGVASSLPSTLPANPTMTITSDASVLGAATSMSSMEPTANAVLSTGPTKTHETTIAPEAQSAPQQVTDAGGSFSALLASIVQGEGDAAAQNGHVGVTAGLPVGAAPPLAVGAAVTQDMLAMPDAALKVDMSQGAAPGAMYGEDAAADAATDLSKSAVGAAGKRGRAAKGAKAAAVKVTSTARSKRGSGEATPNQMTPPMAQAPMAAQLPLPYGTPPYFEGAMAAPGMDGQWRVPPAPSQEQSQQAGAQPGDVLSAAAVLTAAHLASMGADASVPDRAGVLPAYFDQQGAHMPGLSLPMDQMPSGLAGMPAWPAPALPPPPASAPEKLRPWGEADAFQCPFCAADLPLSGADAIMPCGLVRPRCCAAAVDAAKHLPSACTLRAVPQCVAHNHIVCAMCMQSQPVSQYCFNQAGRLARKTCRACHRLVVRGHRHGIKVDEIRTAIRDGSIDKVLPTKVVEARASTPVAPEGKKGCVLCRKLFPLDHFGKGGNGKLNGYCRPCQVLVVRGNRKGLRAAQLRQALEDGTLDTLLPPVTLRSKSFKVSDPTAEGMKRCGMCLQELPHEQFDLAKDGNLRGYCHACHCLVGRANKKGIKAAELRQAIMDGRLEELLPPVKEKAIKSSAGASDDAAANPDGNAQGTCHLCSKLLTKEQMDKSSPAWLRGYCVVCHRLVGKAGRQGVKLDALREAMNNGTVDTLLSGEVASARPLPPAPPGQKGCQLCHQILPEDQFGIVGNGRRRGYCQKCHLLSGRANKRGIRVSQLRAAILDGTVDTLLPPVSQSRHDSTGASNPPPPQPLDAGAPQAAPEAALAATPGLIAHAAFPTLDPHAVAAAVAEAARVAGMPVAPPMPIPPAQSLSALAPSLPVAAGNMPYWDPSTLPYSLGTMEAGEQAAAQFMPSHGLPMPPSTMPAAPPPEIAVPLPHGVPSAISPDALPAIPPAELPLVTNTNNIADAPGKRPDSRNGTSVEQDTTLPPRKRLRAEAVVSANPRLEANEATAADILSLPGTVEQAADSVALPHAAASQPNNNAHLPVNGVDDMAAAAAAEPVSAASVHKEDPAKKRSPVASVPPRKRLRSAAPAADGVDEAAGE